MALNFFDINRLSGNGFLILPLSMSRLHGDQNPINVYRFLVDFLQKAIEKSIDIICIYTNSLYFNSEGIAWEIREKTNYQMLTHKQQMDKLVKSKNDFSPKAVHFLPWDNVILRSDKFMKFYTTLKKISQTDDVFKHALDFDLGIRARVKSNYNFLIEDLVVTHLIRQNYINFQSTLANSNGWKLIAYPGNFMTSDVYAHKHEFLPINTLTPNKYGSCMYNISERKLVDFDYIKDDDLDLIWERKKLNLETRCQIEKIELEESS